MAAGETGLAGGKNGGQQRRIAELEKEIEGRDQVIGELTIVNRVLKNFRASPTERGDARDGPARGQGTIIGPGWAC